MKNSNKTSAILFLICSIIWGVLAVLDFIEKGSSVKFYLDVVCFVFFLFDAIVYFRLAKKNKKDTE